MGRFEDVDVEDEEQVVQVLKTTITILSKLYTKKCSHVQGELVIRRLLPLQTLPAIIPQGLEAREGAHRMTKSEGLQAGGGAL